VRRLAPLVVTLELDRMSQDRFDDERGRYFPVGRTVVGAHLTLFHALPGEYRHAVSSSLGAAAGARYPVHVVEVVSLGAGVAYRLASSELMAMHAGVRAVCAAWLTAQDQQGFRPHVTVQNKVSADVARRTLAELRSRFVPFDCTASALRLWRYDGGPWTLLERVPFSDH
jgi:2'-5' RNA ligase